jgi:hypothetical protein
MDTAKYNLHIQSGETVIKQFKLLSANGQPFDLTGYTLQSYIKKDHTSTTASAVFTCSSANPAEGLFQLTLPSASSAALTGSCYFYDFRISSGSLTVYPLEGKVVVSPSITR